MRKLQNLTKLVLCAALVAPLVGCGGDDESAVKQVGDAKEMFGCNVINVFNAGEYIGEGVISDFETMYNAKVNYDLFESNEMMYTKLLGGSSYDVLVPSDYMIEQLLAEKMLQPLDKKSYENLGLLNPSVVESQKGFDPTLEYSVPYFWGNVGLVYNKTTVDEKDIEEEGWDILKDPKYKGRIFFYDSQRDGFMIAFKALGYSMNTNDPKQIQEAYEWLSEMNATMEPAYVTDEVIDGMTNAEKDIAVMYSGDATNVLTENMDMSWVAPKQGTNVWIDAMVIPKNSNCPGLANKFIDYIISESVQIQNSEWVGYTPVDLSVQEELAGPDGEFFENPAYVPRTGYKLDETFHFDEQLKAKLSDLWNKVKVQ